MGFFIEEQPEAAKAPARRTTTGTKRVLTEGEHGCDACTLRSTWPRLAGARMTLAGNTTDPSVLVLGSAPTEEDDRKGAAFATGEAAKLLRTVIPYRYLEQVTWQNVVRCHPDNDRAPTAAEKHACGVHLEADVARLPIKAILGLGPAPLSQFVTGSKLNMGTVFGTRFPIALGGKLLWYYPVFHPADVITGANKRWVENSKLYPVFAADIKRFFAEYKRWPKPQVDDDLLPSTIVVARTEEEARGVLRRMKAPRAVDLETIRLRPMERTSRLLCAAFSDGDLSVAFPINHPEARYDWALPLLLETVEAEPWIAHNAGFELAWILWHARQLNLPWHYEPARFDDTQALVRIYHQHEKLLSLEAASRIHCGVNIKQILNINTERILEYPLHEVLQYCGLDAKASAKIYRRLIDKVNFANYESINQATYATTEMMLLGLPVDQGVARGLSAEWRARAQDAEERARTYYEVREWERVNGRRWNIASTDDVGEALVQFGKCELPKAAKKEWQVDEGALQPLVDAGNPVAAAVLDHREATKMDATYLSAILEVPERYVDNLLHPGYTTSLVSTLRLSSEGPNIQNFPKRNQEQNRIREAIVAPPGCLYYAFDYGQLEARVLAMAAHDFALCKAFIQNFDIHLKWLDHTCLLWDGYMPHIFSKTGFEDPEKLRKAARDEIKSDVVFASFYGATIYSVIHRTGMPEDIAQQLLADFWREYPDIQRWIKARRKEYKETGGVSNLMGVTRHDVYYKGNEPINTPIQSTAARIVVDAMNEMAQLSRKERDIYLHPRKNIHDDLGFFLPEDQDTAAQYIEVIRKVLLRVRYEWQIVPLTIEAKVGERWSNLEKFALFEGDYIK